MIQSVTKVPALSYKVTSSNPGAVTASLSGTNSDTLNLSILAGATGGATITVTVTDLAGKTLTKTFSVMVPSVSVTAGKATSAETASGKPVNTGNFVISRTGPTTLPLTVEYAVTGSATNGVDYTTIPSTVTIPAGKSSATVTVAPIDNSLVDGTRTVVATLVNLDSQPYSIGTPVSATVSISDNELTTVSITAQTPSASEIDPTDDPGVFRIARQDTTADAITVSFTRSGTATNGSDYTLRLAGTTTTLTANSVTIPANVSYVDVELVPVDDHKAEPPETARLTLSTSTKYLLGAKVADVTIVDSSPVVSIAPGANAAEPDTAGSFVISRTGSTAAPLTVTFTRSGTATAGTDYVNFPTSVVIPAGASSATVFVQPLADTKAEPAESVALKLSTSTAYNLAALATNQTASIVLADGAKSAAADLVITGLTYTGKTYSLSALAGATLPLSAQVLDQGLAAASGPVQVNFFLSQDRTLGNADDVALGSASPASLSAGQSGRFAASVAMGTVTGLTAGQFYVIAQVEANGETFISALNNIIINP
jgi:hypothetical protein